MIVIGYQGIGKSTLAGYEGRYIDLESGNFWVDGERADDWYKPYCQIAEHLSQQGYIVFTSSHEVVRKQLESSEEYVLLVYPSVELKDQWIAKLERRYERTGLEKDYKALMNAKDRYEDNIRELDKCAILCKCCITDMDYNLNDILTGEEKFFEEYGYMIHDDSDCDWDDHCYECTGYGDDYSTDENGELVSNCDDCPFNSSRNDWDD